MNKQSGIFKTQSNIDVMEYGMHHRYHGCRLLFSRWLHQRHPVSRFVLALTVELWSVYCKYFGKYNRLLDHAVTIEVALSESFNPVHCISCFRVWT